MWELLPYLKQIIPEGMENLARRYELLRAIDMQAPAGRRSLALSMHMPERLVRSETEKMAAQGLVEVDRTGMTLSPAGKDAVSALEEFIHELLGLRKMEERLTTKLGVKSVTIVAGDCEQTPEILNGIGRETAKFLLNYTDENSIVALTGGSTIEAMVNAVSPQTKRHAAMVVPARGSVGHKVGQQSDTLAAVLAGKLQSEYRLLNLPDNIGVKAMNELKNEPAVQDTMMYLRQADFLILGIGNAMDMAEKRRVSDTIYDYLKRRDAVAEALGHYFGPNGSVVYTSHSVSIDLSAVRKIPFVLAAAGGRSKAESIQAVCAAMSSIHLIIDEGAAAAILEKGRPENKLASLQ